MNRSRARATTRRPVQRFDAQDVGLSAEDEVAVEEPLELRLSGESFAITMRTPGHDRELSLGLLLSEGVIASAADVGGAFHCGRPGEPGYGNTLELAPAPGTAFALDADPRGAERGGAQRWGTLRHAACGVCGRANIEDLLARLPPARAARPPLPRALLRSAVAQLSQHQPGFERSGGLHAAAIVDGAGRALAAHEDVGRHNAVDKAVGALLLSGALPCARVDEHTPCVLSVSGRVSFEIVQKAAMAGLFAVCGVSAPSSLAIDLARATGVQLAAFVREGRLTLY